MKEKVLPQLIKEVIEHHHDLLWSQNVKNATNIEEFEKWCAISARNHAVITLKYLFTDEEFESIQSADGAAE